MFTGFQQEDFDTFLIDGLDERMTAIRKRIQPKFQEVGVILQEELSILSGQEMFLHVAKHARRTINPPKDTWLAISANKRGYKQHPHFQVGLFDDHVFIWLAFINECMDKKNISDTFLNHINLIRKHVPNFYLVSQDHTKKEAVPFGELSLEEVLGRLKNVKKAEFLVGQHISKNNPILNHGSEFLSLAKETFETLFPVYHLAYQ